MHYDIFWRKSVTNLVTAKMYLVLMWFSILKFVIMGYIPNSKF